MKFTVQRHTLTKRLRPNYKIIEHFPPTTPHHHITISLFTAVPLPSTLCPASKGKKKLQGISKGKITKQTNKSKKKKHTLEGIEQTSEQTQQQYWNFQTDNLKQL